MKTCAQCKAIKPKSDFYIDSTGVDGYRRNCKVCVRANASRWHLENVAQRKRTRAAWEQANRQVAAARRARWEQKNPRWRAQWKAKNPASLARYARKWRRANLAKCAALSSAHHAGKLQATPAWANQGYIEDVYRKAAIFTKRDGTPWHVDHIVPLMSKVVCGLHCEDNLQTLPGVDNQHKGNRSWPDMPGAL